MEAGITQRIRVALLVGLGGLASAAGLIAAAEGARSGAPDPRLLPDLVVERPQELYLAKTRSVLRLRTSNTVANQGTGPLEITGGDESDPACFVPGRPVGRPTMQTIYDDDPSATGSIGHFWRGDDEASTSRDAGCSRFHDAHDHWHFDNFARFALFSERTGNRVGVARKVSFCVLDTDRPYPDLDGSPPASYYPQDPGGANPKTPSCSATSVDGVSIGWEDTYGASLPGQGIDITGIRRGSYCLVLEADPATDAAPAGGLLERDESNNVRDLRLRIRPRREVLRRVGPECRVPV